MKTTFTFLRTSITVLILTSLFSSASAQSTPSGNSTISNLTARVENNNIVINWNISELNADYCQVQASTDGKNFQTIGFVLGADPKAGNNSFAFKQNLSKMKAGHKYYRVVSINSGAVGVASEAVKAVI